MTLFWNRELIRTDPKQIGLVYKKAVQVDSNGDLLIAGLRQKQPKHG